MRVTCCLVCEPWKGAFPAAGPSAGQAGLSLLAFVQATEKIQGFAGLREAGHQGEKKTPIPSPAGNVMEELSS